MNKLWIPTLTLILVSAACGCKSEPPTDPFAKERESVNKSVPKTFDKVPDRPDAGNLLNK